MTRGELLTRQRAEPRAQDDASCEVDDGVVTQVMRSLMTQFKGTLLPGRWRGCINDA